MQKFASKALPDLELFTSVRQSLFSSSWEKMPGAKIGVNSVWPPCVAALLSVLSEVSTEMKLEHCSTCSVCRPLYFSSKKSSPLCFFLLFPVVGRFISSPPNRCHLLAVLSSDTSACTTTYVAKFNPVWTGGMLDWTDASPSSCQHKSCKLVSL